jgi:hypothetical protein
VKNLVFVCAVAAMASGCVNAQTAPSKDNPSALQADAQARSVTQADVQSLATITGADLDAAVKISNDNGDAVGAGCFAALKDWIGAPKPAAQPAVGVFSALARARGGVSRIRAGVPPAVHIACAPVIVDAETVGLRLGAIATGLK